MLQSLENKKQSQEEISQVISNFEKEIVRMIRNARVKVCHIAGDTKFGLQVFDLCEHEPNFEFPEKSQQTYDNPLIGFIHTRNSRVYNYIMKNGHKSNLPTPPKNSHGKPDVKEVRVEPAGAIVRKDIMYGDCSSHSLYGVQFYDAKNNKLLESGYCKGSTKKVFTLNEDERIVGVKLK